MAYLIAAAGPVGFGWLHDLTTGWAIPMMGLSAAAVMQVLVGFSVGREGRA